MCISGRDPVNCRSTPLWLLREYSAATVSYGSTFTRRRPAAAASAAGCQDCRQEERVVEAIPPWLEKRAISTVPEGERAEAAEKKNWRRSARLCFMFIFPGTWGKFQIIREKGEEEGGRVEMKEGRSVASTE